MAEKLNKHLWWMGGVVILLFFALHSINDKINIPLLYGLLAVSIAIFAYLFFAKKLNYKISILFIIFWGLLVRLFVMYRIDPLGNGYQHDLFFGGFGHWNYIQYFAENWKLPNGYHGVAYHGPIHYIILGTFYWLGSFFPVNIPYFCLCITLFMNFVLFFVMKKLIGLYTASDRAIFWGLLVYIMFPMNIVVSLFLNNDNTYLFFSVVALYYLCLWFKVKSYKNSFLLGAFCALAFLTKIGGAGVALTAFVVLMIYTLTHRHCEADTLSVQRSNPVSSKKQKVAGLLRNCVPRNDILKNIGFFFAAFLPLAGLFFYRLIRIGQSLFYDSEGSRMFGNSLKEFISFDIINIVMHPLRQGRESLFAYLYKSSNFSEMDMYFHSGILHIPKIISAFGLLLILFWIFCLIKNNWRKAEGLIMPVFYAITLIVMIKYRYNNPNGWNQHFRYIIPVVAVYGATISWGIEKLWPWLKYAGYGIISIFCICSFYYHITLGSGIKW